MKTIVTLFAGLLLTTPVWSCAISGEITGITPEGYRLMMSVDRCSGMVIEDSTVEVGKLVELTGEFSKETARFTVESEVSVGSSDLLPIFINYSRINAAGLDITGLKVITVKPETSEVILVVPYKLPGDATYRLLERGAYTGCSPEDGLPPESP